MQILKAKSAGFCFGVSLALKKLEHALMDHPQKPTTNNGGRITTLGPIIHNPPLVKEYSERGVVCLESYHEAQPLDIVIIRAHGVPIDEEKALIEKGCTIIDATCPKVKKAQLGIAKACSGKGRKLLLFGEAHHPEVLGLLSYAPENNYLLFESINDVNRFCPEDGCEYVFAAQTTQARDEFMEIKAVLGSKIKEHINGELVVLETICDATRERQDELNAIAKQVEAFVIVGGKNSGNTRRLAEIAQKSDIYVTHIEKASELSISDLSRYKMVGLTAGASTPNQDINEVEKFLESV